MAVDESGLKSSESNKVSGRKIALGFSPPIKNIKVKADRRNQNIILSWDYEYSSIEHFIIYRSEKEESLQIYKTINSSARSFIDKRVKIDTKYKYALIVQFKDGVQSKFSQLVEVKY